MPMQSPGRTARGFTNCISPLNQTAPDIEPAWIPGAHPEAVPAYATFKRSLAAAVPDIATYSDVKDPVVDLVVIVAESWAATAGWQP